MSGQQNGTAQGAGRRRFVLTPNKFSRAAANQQAPHDLQMSREREASKPKSSVATPPTAAQAFGGYKARAQLAIPAPRPDPRTRFRLTPRPSKAFDNEGKHSNTAGPTKSSAAPNQPEEKQLRTLNSLSADEFCHLAAHSTPSQIATEYGVKLSGVSSQLSKAIRRRADDEQRTLQNVKDELNRKRMASGVISTVDGRYGIRAYRPRAATNTAMVPTLALAGVDKSCDAGDAMEVDEEASGATELSGSIRAARAQTQSGVQGGQEEETVAMDCDEPRSSIAMPVEHAELQEDVKLAQRSTHGANLENLARGEAEVDGLRSERMPTPVLHNMEALHLWFLGYREEAVEKAEIDETKLYLNDFVLTPDQFD